MRSKVNAISRVFADKGIFGQKPIKENYNDCNYCVKKDFEEFEHSVQEIGKFISGFG